MMLFCKFFIVIILHLGSSSLQSTSISDKKKSTNMSLYTVQNDLKWLNPKTSQNETIIVPEVKTVSLECIVKNTSLQPINTLWWKDGLKLHDGCNLSDHEFKLNDQVLWFKSVIISDSGMYQCSVSNQYESINYTYHLHVGAVQWINKKSMQNLVHVPAGSKYRFKCRSNGEEPITTLWYWDGVRITANDTQYKFKRKGQELEIDWIVDLNGGEYKCVASNRLNTIEYTYYLSVAERGSARPLLQLLPPFNKSVYVGSNVEFHCNIVGVAGMTTTVLWIKHRSLDSWNDTSSVKLEKNFTSFKRIKDKFVIRNVTYEDQGLYSCVAANVIGISHESARLTVIPIELFSMTPGVVKSELTPENVRSLKNETLIITVVVVGGLLFFVTMIFLILKQSKLKYFDRGVPMLVAIKNPERIPPMTYLEEPFLHTSNISFRPGCNLEFLRGEPDMQWELKREFVQLCDAIDEGFFGLVYKAKLFTVTGERRDVAVKTLKPTSTDKDVMDLLVEMEQMKKVGSHKNIISLVGVCTQNGAPWLITEYAPQGNLRDYLRRNRPAFMQYNLSVSGVSSNPLNQKDLISAAYQVARGMEYLAQKKCVHRDVAARNILVSDNYVMKVADFGLARNVQSRDYYRKNTRGHLPYKWMAIEAMADNVFTHATDVWSFGVLMWEILSFGGAPYPGVKTQDLVCILRQGERLDRPYFASLELYRLMRDCWEEYPQRRPTFRQLVEDLDRMLAAAASLEYIDLSSFSLFESVDSDESGIVDVTESQRESAQTVVEDDDSVFNLLPRDTGESTENNPLLVS